MLQGSMRSGYYHWFLLSVDWAAGLEFCARNYRITLYILFSPLQKKDEELNNVSIFSAGPCFPSRQAPLRFNKKFGDRVSGARERESFI